jgi:hypothetical protein
MSLLREGPACVKQQDRLLASRLPPLIRLHEVMQLVVRHRCCQYPYRYGALLSPLQSRVTNFPTALGLLKEKDSIPSKQPAADAVSSKGCQGSLLACTLYRGSVRPTSMA